MTVIRPNSVSGINSITGFGGDISIFRADGTTGDLVVNNVTTGVVTATFVGGHSGNGAFSGNLGVGGVLTYEDVTNIDSVGVIQVYLVVIYITGTLPAISASIQMQLVPNANITGTLPAFWRFCTDLV